MNATQLCLICGRPIKGKPYYTLHWPGAKFGQAKLAHLSCELNREVTLLQNIMMPTALLQWWR